MKEFGICNAMEKVLDKLTFLAKRMSANIAEEEEGVIENIKILCTEFVKISSLEAKEEHF